MAKRSHQLDPFSDAERVHPARSVEERWTPELTDRGWTTVPNRFLDSYSLLNPAVTHGEAMFVIHIIRYKWDKKAPFPSLANIAKQMGISTTSARALARSLERKSYLRREGTPGRTNRYHLDRLFVALETIRYAPSATQPPVETIPDGTDVEISF